MVEMELREIQISHVSPNQIVILAEKDGERTFPIFIGLFEAEAMESAARQRKAARPLTHDLILNVIEGMQAELEGIMVDELADNTFHGKLLVKNADGKHIKIDCRPSDAIVLATKAQVPIYVSDEVLRAASGSPDE